MADLLDLKKLREVRDWHRMTQQACLDAANSYPQPDTTGDMYWRLHDEHKELADSLDNAIDAYEAIARDADLRRESNLFALLKDLVDALDGAFISSWQSTAAWSVQLDAARHAAAKVPDAMRAFVPDGRMDDLDHEENGFIRGWNACREAMIAQGNGGASASSPDIKAMVDRFLGWKLPANFSPDCGISFDKESLNRWPGLWPMGTNLLTADQAKVMFEYALTAASQTEVDIPKPS